MSFGGTKREVTLYVQLFVPSRKRWLLVQAMRYSSKSPDCELYDNWEFLPSPSSSSSSAARSCEDAPVEWYCKTLKRQYNPVVFDPQLHARRCLETNSVLETSGLLDPHYHVCGDIESHYQQQQQQQRQRRHDYVFDDASNFLPMDRAVVWGKEVGSVREVDIPPHDRDWTNWHGGCRLVETRELECWKCRLHLRFLRKAWRWKYVPPCVFETAAANSNFLDNLPTEAGTCHRRNADSGSGAEGREEHDGDRDEIDATTFLEEWTYERRVETRIACLRVMLKRIVPNQDAMISHIVEGFVISPTSTSSSPGEPPTNVRLRLHQHVSFSV